MAEASVDESSADVCMDVATKRINGLYFRFGQSIMYALGMVLGYYYGGFWRMFV